MVSIKNLEEVSYMKEAGRIVALTHKRLKSEIRPGISTKHLDFIAKKFIISMGATPSFLGYGGFKASICTSVNDCVVHGVPSDDVILNDGDIISIDIGACFKGYHGDSAWSYKVGNVSQEAQELLKIGELALYEGLKQVKDGVRVGDISSAIGNYVRNAGYSVPLEYTGHGIGRSLHEEPAIPNFGYCNTGMTLKKGMTVAIEPMVIKGKPFTKVLADGWSVVTKDKSLSVHFEHTIYVTEDGYEILTKED